MRKWTFVELRKLCRQKNVPESTIYQNSLEWRWRRADFHAEKAQEIWAELFSSPFTLGDRRFNEAVFSYETHVEACVQALHSVDDIFAQIINVVILENSYQEHQVSTKRLTNVMEKNKVALQVRDRMGRLLDSLEFRYLDAFCNTIKHRRLIPGRFRAEYGDYYRNESGIRFLQFNYKNKTYPEIWASDILQEYRQQIGQFVNDVGLSINKFVADSKL